MKIISNIQSGPTPEGKRTIRRTVRGSIMGYINGKFWVNLGDCYDPNAEADAEVWLNGFPIAD